MKSERWQEIERLYHAALEREPGGRGPFLKEVCGVDRALRREVEGLLAHQEQAEGFIEEPAVMIAARDLAEAAPELVPGQMLGRYRILSLLGAGGMGMVYAARDSRLERTVALKFLLQEFAGDPEALQRFRREARALSALNHPNICNIYDIDEAGGRTFIAMECVPGDRLDRLIGRKGLPLNELLKYAIEIADGLAKAHAAGIVHRDLKPGNIMVTGEGHVKLLDFGLAKLTGVGLGDVSATTRKLSEAPHSEAGTILGTVAYVSPEQAEGRKVDTRSDIFSFGSVLYEMITGARAFPGETKLSTLAAILHSEPRPLNQMSAGMPRELERIVARCLRKDPERRFQDAADVRVALQEIREESESGRLAAASEATPRFPIRALALAIALCVTAAAVGIWWWNRNTPRTASRVVLTRLTSEAGLTTDPAISPDGKLLAYASDSGGEENLAIWVQQVAGGRPMRLTSDAADNTEPNFSPDGTRIAFRSQREGGGIYVISALGGEERLIAKAGHGPRFSPDGRWIAYYAGAAGGKATRTYIVPSTGGSPRELKMQIPWAGAPTWSPDGRQIIFVGSSDPYASNYSGVFDWWVVPMEGGQAIKTGALATFGRNGLDSWKSKTLFTRTTLLAPAAWVENHILFSAGLGDTTNLWRVAIAPGTWQVTDPPERITTGADQEVGASVAASGRLVFATIDQHLDLWSLPLDANSATPTGKPQQLTQSGANSLRPYLSADGRKLIYLSYRSGNADIWLRDMESGKETPVTATPWDENHPSISADGSRVSFASLETGTPTIYAQSTGKGVADKLCSDCGQPMGWSPDGRKIFYAWGKPTQWSSIDAVTRQRVDVIHSEKSNLHMLRQSADGNWLAVHMPTFTSDGSSPIFIAPIRNGVAGGESEWIQVTDGTGLDSTPWWSPDGAIVYFLSKRDGFVCIWAQHLNGETKQPTGTPFDVAHFHGARHKVEEVGFGPGVSPKLLVFTSRTSTGNIWSLTAETRK